MTPIALVLERITSATGRDPKRAGAGWASRCPAHGITDDGQHVNIANTNRYRICGNGIVANVTQWIANRLPEAA